MINVKLIVAGLGIILLIFLLSLWLLHKRSVSRIPPNTDATISIKDNTVEINQAGRTSRVYAPRGTVLTLHKDGSTEIVSRQYGLTCEPGLGAMWERSDIMPTVDMKFAYLYRFGLNVGVGLDVKTRPYTVSMLHPTLSLSYALPFSMLSNTAVFAGHGFVSGRWIAGIRVRF